MASVSCPPMIDLRPFIDSVRKIVSSHALDQPGAYRRWLWQDTQGRRDLGLNPYGCADAANILYTIGDFPCEDAERRGWVETLRNLQAPESGLFHEATHHDIHCTAHCIAAIELFDATPAHPVSALHRLLHPGALEDFLDGLDWRHNPWGQSHQGAGAYAALVIAREAPLEWEDRYFRWLDAEADPATGFWRKGAVAPIDHGGRRTLFPHLAGTFHYLFNYEAGRRALPFPAAMIDTCLQIQSDGVWPLGNVGGFAEIDWVFCITRSLRQCGHRFADCRSALERFTGEWVEEILAADPATHDQLNDLHALFGLLCALAELQQALPGTLRTERPLKLVLDRRPFI